MSGIVVNLPDEKIKALDAMGKADAGSGTPRQRGVRLATAAVVALVDAGGDPELFAVRFVEAKEAGRREDLRAKRKLLLDGVAAIDGVLDDRDQREDEVADELYAAAGHRSSRMEREVEPETITVDGRSIRLEVGADVRYGIETLTIDQVQWAQDKPYRASYKGAARGWFKADEFDSDEETA